MSRCGKVLVCWGSSAAGVRYFTGIDASGAVTARPERGPTRPAPPNNPDTPDTPT